MFQTIEERKAAVSDLPDQTHTSLTEEDSYVGEWICTRNRHAGVPFSLQFVHRDFGHPASCYFHIGHPGSCYFQIFVQTTASPQFLPTNAQ